MGKISSITIQQSVKRQTSSITIEGLFIEVSLGLDD